MTDYLEDYRKALRKGNVEEANELYHKYRGDEEEEAESTDDSSSEEEEKLEMPGDMTVGEAKDYADSLEGEALEKFYDYEVEGKDRTTLVDHLEKLLE